MLTQGDFKLDWNKEISNWTETQGDFKLDSNKEISNMTDMFYCSRDASVPKKVRFSKQYQDILC